MQRLQTTWIGRQKLPKKSRKSKVKSRMQAMDLFGQQLKTIKNNFIEYFWGSQIEQIKQITMNTLSVHELNETIVRTL